ncbi:DUF1631 family protein [Thiolapillus brandeum]|nr:DUF1631 family protein [Thiolapillus brandeum]
MLESGFTPSEPGNESSAIVIDWGIHKDIVEECQRRFSNTLPSFCEALFAQVDEDIYRLIKASTSEARRTLLFESMWRFQERHQEIQDEYLRIAPQWFFSEYHLQEDFPDLDDDDDDEEESFAWSSDKDKLEDEARLSLLDDKQLEENVALTTTISQANQAFARELFALEERFASMQGKPVKSAATMPISPVLLANTLRDILDAWDDEVIVRITIYQSLSKTFSKYLKTLYRDTNSYLKNRGILPNLKTNHIRNVSYEHQPHQADSPSPEFTATTSRGANLPDVWYQFQGGAPVIQSASNPALPVLPRYEVLQTLSQLQASVLSEVDTDQIDWNSVQEHLRQQVNQALCLNDQGQPTQRVERNDQQVIEVIFRLFDHILGDDTIPSTIRTLLGRLQIPVLKTAIQDPTFVDNETHAARQLLDSIASASIGSNSSDKAFHNQVKQIVERIVEEYEDDMAVFEDTLHGFERYLQTREKAQKIKEQRITQAIAGKEQLAVAKQKISDLLDSPVLATAPQAVQDIINKPWADFLTLVLLREGEEGKAWKKAIAVTQAVEQYFDPDVTDADRQQFRASIPGIMKAFQQGLDYISINKAKSHEMLGQFLDAFDTVSQVSLEETRRNAPAQPPKAPPTESETAQEADKFSEMALSMPDGTWIRVIGKGDQPPLVCKLVWHSQFTHTMLFVDGNGHKALQIKDIQLAEQLRNGTAEIIADASVPFVTRMLNRMRNAFSTASPGNNT